MTLRDMLLALLAMLTLAPGCSQSATAPYIGVAPQGNASAGAHFATSTCAACHGAHGNSLSGANPNLAGQNYNYLLKQLEDFRSGARKAAPMNAMIGTVPKTAGQDNLKNIAAYYTDQSLDRKANANAHAPRLTKAEASTGYEIFQQGLPSQHVPSCAACHSTDGTGMAPMAIPSLAGQQSPYVEKQLKMFADGTRQNSPGHVMATIAKRLTPAQIKAVALYAQALRPKLIPGSGPKSYQAYVKGLAGQPVPGIPAGAVKGSKTATTTGR
jgi:cytochrome c553